MKGNHHVIIQSKGLKYEFDIKRNITVVRGDSATGKTTLVNMIKDYTKTLNNGIIIQSDVPCDVFSGSSDTWETYVRNRKETIIFVDEDIDYMSTVEFAETIKKVIIIMSFLLGIISVISHTAQKKYMGLEHQGSIIFLNRFIMSFIQFIPWKRHRQFSILQLGKVFHTAPCF